MSGKKMTRRLFMRAAPVAPLAVQTAATDVMLGMPQTVGLGADCTAMPLAAGADVNWFRERKAELERRMRGELSEREQANEALSIDMTECHIQALRSVSPVHKRLMARTAYREMERERNKMWARFDLEDLLKSALR